MKTYRPPSTTFGRIIIILVSICTLFSVVGFGANPQNSERRKYYDIAELKKLVAIARNAGATEEQIHKMEIRDGDTVRNVMEYIAELERLEEMKRQKLKEFKSKKFLTVKDIYKDLAVEEKDVIKKLREDIVSER